MTFTMKQQRYTVDQIIPKLREADVDLDKGLKVPDVCKRIGITTRTGYRWRQKYGAWLPKWRRSSNISRRRMLVVRPWHSSWGTIGGEKETSNRE